MAHDVPLDRVRQLQADLRRLSGFPSYDHTDPSLPPLPSIADAVASLDPTISSSIRCGLCRGGLLRGLHSTLCIYCGADRRKEGFSHSISFNSTFACGKLLDFLGLNGSESVLLDTESTGSNKGQGAPKGELVLSDLLDLELRWPSDKEDFDDHTTITSPSLEEDTLNLIGFDIENLFSERKRERSSNIPGTNKELMLGKNTETGLHVSSCSENFAAFEKLNTMDAEANASSSNSDDSFAVWNAEFQPPTTRTGSDGDWMRI